MKTCLMKENISIKGSLFPLRRGVVSGDKSKIGMRDL